MQINNTAIKKEISDLFNTYPVMKGTQTVYNHEEFGQIRGLMQDDDLWVVAKDVADILGYSDTNAMTRHLDADESMPVNLTGMNMPHTVISEAGLYSAIIRSRVEGAKRFKRWITHEILPSIRKHGFYDTDNFIDNILANPKGIVSSLEKHKDDRLRRQLEEQQSDEVIKTKNKQIALLKGTLQRKDEKLISQKRKIEYFEWLLYEHDTWTPARSISWLKNFYHIDQCGFFRGIGQRLSYSSRQLELNPRQIEHPTLGVVNFYHKDAIQDFHDTVIKDPNFMKKFRK